MKVFLALSVVLLATWTVNSASLRDFEQELEEIFQKENQGDKDDEHVAAKTKAVGNEAMEQDKEKDVKEEDENSALDDEYQKLLRDAKIIEDLNQDLEAMGLNDEDADTVKKTDDDDDDNDEFLELMNLFDRDETDDDDDDDTVQKTDDDESDNEELMKMMNLFDQDTDDEDNDVAAMDKDTNNDDDLEKLKRLASEDDDDDDDEVIEMDKDTNNDDALEKLKRLASEDDDDDEVIEMDANHIDEDDDENFLEMLQMLADRAED